MANERSLRILLVVVALAAALVCVGVDSVYRWQDIQAFMDARVPSSPEKPELDGTSPTGYASGRRVLVLTNGADGYHWIMQTQQMIAGEGLRIRRAAYDNSPEGREVHWSSLLRWWLALVGLAHSVATGWPWAASVERVAPCATTLLLALALIGLAPPVMRRFGAAAAVVLVLGMVLFGSFYELFWTGAPDHHGIVALSCMLTVLFVVAGGGGWVQAEVAAAEPARLAWFPRRQQARRWFAASGIAGGAGLWVSAATQVPVLLGLGVGAVLSLVWLAKPILGQGVLRLAPTLWRTWGRAGAMTSVAFYLLEYFPGDMGMRLEVNHPLFALAWLGGGELLFRLYTAKSTGTWTKGDLVGLLLGLAALVTLPAVIWWAPAETFWVADPFIWALHEDYILEFKGLVDIWQTSSWAGRWQLSLVPVLGSLCAALLWRRDLDMAWKSLLVLSLGAGMVGMGLTFKQVRWLGPTCGVWLAILVTMVAMVCFGGCPVPWTRRQKIAAGLLLAGVFSLPCVTFSLSLNQPRGQLVLHKTDVLQMESRDAAYQLRQRLGDDQGVVLGGGTTTTWMIYFGSLQGMGTLYWENMPGLKAAAAIYAATSADEAYALIRRAKITHLVLCPWQGFDKEYVRLARGLRGDVEPAADGFISQLIRARRVPSWLRPLYFPVPRDELLQQQFLAIFEVAPAQSEAEAHVRMGQYDLAHNRPALAEAELRKALELSPNFLPALIWLARLHHSLGQSVDLQGTLDRINQNLSAAGNLALEDQVGLAVAFSLGNDQAQLRRQLAACWAQADEKSLRRLDCNTLFNLLYFSERLHVPAGERHGLARSLLLPHWRDKLPQQMP